jgi:hypothetical protein
LRQYWFRSVIVQVATPDAYRGRISAAEFVVGVSCPNLGKVRAGVLGSLTSPTVSVGSGGLSTVVGAVLVGLALPAFVRYQAPTSTSTSGGVPGEAEPAAAAP